MSRLRHIALLLAVLLCLGLAGLAQAIEPLPFKNEAQRLRFQHLTSELRCMVCQDESLNASQADLARDLRLKIFTMMQEGKSDEQIKQYLVDRYSQFILYDPPLQPHTWLLWFGPGLVLLCGAGALWLFVRRRSRPDAPAATAGDDNW
ncbi:MAG TPA: cytochrome c-type biogenesis protein [Rhodanobacteraceae bacterium]|nr:cytochrome c-type biogenesis protein [Rhodanobacteraceae bacterium]